LAATKGALIEEHEEFLIDCVMERLHLLDSVSEDDLRKFTPEQLVQRGFVDPVRFFGKNEPHTVEKMRLGRLRLIASVSIVDEIIERLLCATQNEAEIDNWMLCPSKPGMGLSQDFQARKLYQYAEPHLSTSRQTDVSGWDWCMQYWMFMLDCSARIRLCGAPEQGAFARILRNRMTCLATSLLITSDGQMFVTAYRGIMKSGSYLTSSTNSRVRVALAYLVGASFAMAMGDDCNETDTDHPFERYLSLGIRLKGVSDCPVGTFEFCSHVFDGEVARPLNGVKSLFRLLTSAPSHELLMQFRQEMRHSADLPRLERVILESGWSSKIVQPSFDL
jgi:hypothetical protein